MAKTTTAPAYTAGPYEVWHNDAKTDWIVQQAKGTLAICRLFPENAEANARLFSAAPALASALETLLDLFLDGNMGELTEREQEVIRTASDALDTAYGVDAA